MQCENIKTRDVGLSRAEDEVEVEEPQTRTHQQVDSEHYKLSAMAHCKEVLPPASLAEDLRTTSQALLEVRTCDKPAGPEPCIDLSA